MDDDLPFPVQLVIGIVMIASVVWVNWCVVVAFIGGTMPIVGWEVDGGIGFGLLFLLLIEPIFLMLAYWASMLICLPLVFLFTRGERDR